MRLVIVKNGDACLELESLAKGAEPTHSYIYEIGLLQSLGEILVIGFSEGRGGWVRHRQVTAVTIPLRRGASAKIRVSGELWRAISQFGPDVIVVLHPWELLIVPYLWSTTHGGRFLPCLPKPLLSMHMSVGRKLLTRLVVLPILRRSERVLARCTLIKNQLTGQGVESERVRIYLPHYDSSFFDTPVRMDVDRKGFNLVFIGRLVRLKGVFDLIDIFEKVSRRIRQSHLYVIGDGPERMALESQVKRRQLDHVTFVGEIPQQHVFGYLSPADVAVLPSYQEGIGKVALEAMLSGLAVVASAATGFEEFIQDGSNGVLVPAGDTDGFAMAVVSLFEQPDELARLRRNARQTGREIIRAENSFETCVREFSAG